MALSREEVLARHRMAQAKYCALHHEQKVASVKKWGAKNHEKRLAMNLASRTRWSQRNAEKVKAHGLVKAALNSGILIRSPFCLLCWKACATHGHHQDYSKPLDVVWLCSWCHAFVHGRANKKGLAL